MSFRNKLLSGLFWSATERFGTQGIQLVISIIIARILTPADYGLIGMIAIFNGVALIIINGGFGKALIYKQNVSQGDLSTVFYYNIFISVILFAILYFTAPLIAKFYNQSLLTPITRIMGLNFLITAFGLIQNTILTKDINFKILTKINILSVIISGGIGIFMAYNGFGVWSLVFQSIGSTLIRTIFLWIFSKWRPSLIFRFESLKSLFSYGSKLLISGLLNTIFDNAYQLIIGKQYNSTALGYYVQAKRIQEIPITNSIVILDHVTFPLYATIQNEGSRLENVYRKTIKGIIYFNFPLMIGLAVLSPLLIKILLTDKWMQTVPYLQLLCFAGLVYPLSAVNLNILKVKGRTDIFLYLEVAKMFITIIAMLITIKMGVLIIIVGQVIVSYICFFLNIYYVGRLANYTVKQQLLDLLPNLGVSIVMGASMYILISVISLTSICSICKLILTLLSAIIIYLILTNIFNIKYDLSFK